MTYADQITPTLNLTMSDQTFHITSEDVRSAESKESKFHDGKTPKDSDVSAMKVKVPWIPKAYTYD